MDIDDLRRKLGERVKSERKAQGMTQRKFADVVGLGQSYISEVERGESSVGFNNLCRIAYALGMEPWELIKF